MAVVQVFASFGAPNVSFAFSKPACRRHLLLGEKLHAFLALHVQIAEEGFVPAVEREPCHGGRHADVDPHHAALMRCLNSRAALPERVKMEAPLPYGERLAVSMAAPDLHAHHVQHWAKNFLLRHRHARLDLVENSGADKEAVRALIHFHPASIGGDLRAFLHAGSRSTAARDPGVAA